MADIAKHGPAEVVALAVSHADCEDLADRIRSRLQAHGLIQGPELIGPAWREDLCLDCDAPQDWASDGSRVLVEAGRPTGLFLIDLATRARRKLAAHATWNLDMARFSPDGQWTAFHTTTSPNSRHVYVVPAGARSIPQTEWVPVVTDHGCHPSWSPDGTGIYHFSFRDGAFCLWVQRVHPETKRPLGDCACIQPPSARRRSRSSEYSSRRA